MPLLWTVFGQHWVGNLSSSFPHSTPACTGSKDQGSQQANEIWRRSAGHCRIILLCQASHSAEYMLNSAAGLGPAVSFPSSLRSQQCVCRSCPAQPGCWALSASPSPWSYSIWKCSLCSSRGASSCSLHTSTRHWPATPPEGGLAPLQNKCLPISDTYWLYL